MQTGQKPTEPPPPVSFRVGVVEQIGGEIIRIAEGITDVRARDVAMHVTEIGFAVAGILSQSTSGVLNAAGWDRSLDHVCHEHAYAGVLLLASSHVPGESGEVAILSQVLACMRAIAATAQQ